MFIWYYRAKLKACALSKWAREVPRHSRRKSLLRKGWDGAYASSTDVISALTMKNGQDGHGTMAALAMLDWSMVVDARLITCAWNLIAQITPTPEDSVINHRNFWLNGGYYFPSLEFAICPVVGLFANGTRWTIRSSGNWALNSSSIGDGLKTR